MGFHKMIKEAVKWYSTCCRTGAFNFAQFNIGNAIYFDRTWEVFHKTYEEAVKWSKLAAEQGDA